MSLNLTTKDKSHILFKQGKFVPVMNLAEGRDWFNKLHDLQRLNSKPFSDYNYEIDFCLLSDNRDRFKRMFGKPTFTFRGEFFYKDYIFEYQNHLFLVGTAKGKGTVYEVCKMDGFPFTGVVEDFLDEFHKQLLIEVDKEYDKV